MLCIQTWDFDLQDNLTELHGGYQLSNQIKSIKLFDKF